MMEREDYTDVGTVDAEDVGPIVPESWRLFDDVEVMELPDPEFLIDGVLPRRAVGAIVAPPGVGKTTLVASLATSLATGRDWLGIRSGTQAHPSSSAPRIPAGSRADSEQRSTRSGSRLIPP